MKKTKRILSLLLISVLLVGMTFATGCSKKDSPKDTLVVTINDQKINMDEMMYYISAIEAQGAQMDAYYQQMTGTSYWDMEYEKGVTMRDQSKKYAMETSQMYHILYDKAVKDGLKLTDDEKKQAETTADSVLKNMSKEQLKITGFTKDSLVNVQEKLLVGEKYYNKIIEGLNIDENKIKDSIKFDDHRQYNTEYLFAPTTKYDKDYKSVELTDKEKAAAKASLTKALDKVKAGTKFADIVKDDKTIQTSTLNFVYGDQTADTAYQDAAIKLENDAYTKDIVQTSTGYYIIKMIDNKSTESYDAAVKDAVSKEQDKGFKTEFEKIKKDYKIVVNNKVWDKIVMGETTLVKSSDANTTAGSSTGNTADTTDKNNTGNTTDSGNTTNTTDTKDTSETK